VIDAPVQVNRGARDVNVAALLVEDLLARDVEDGAIGIPGGGDDAKVVIDRVGAERAARRIGAGPGDQFRVLVGQAPVFLRLGKAGLPALGAKKVAGQCA